MELDFSKLTPSERYKILTAVVVPRPIAWVTTMNAAGMVNAAPFSFFNAMGSDPAVVALGIAERAPGVPKDSFKNIRDGGEFVVNLVTYAARDVMNRSAADFPPEVSEIEAVGLETLPSVVVKPPRLALSPVCLECRLAQIVEIGRTRVTLGEVVHVHIADEFYNPKRGYVASEKLDLIGRMHGRGWYSRTTDLIEVKRVKPDGTTI